MRAGGGADPLGAGPRGRWFVHSYRRRNLDRGITPLGFVRALRAMTDKRYGCGEAGRQALRSMTGGLLLSAQSRRLLVPLGAVCHGG